jgi:hypothetical protein
MSKKFQLAYEKLTSEGLVVNKGPIGLDQILINENHPQNNDIAN